MKRVDREVVEYQLYAQLIEEYSNQLNLLNTAYLEAVTAINGLEELKSMGGSLETLTPVGSGALIYSKVERVEKALINVGANVYIEKSVDDAIETLKNRRERIKKSIEEVQMIINELYSKAKSLEEKLRSRLEKSGES